MQGTYTIDELKTIVGKVAKQYGIKKAALFGSYSRGTQTENSDIDLLIDKGELRGLIMFNAFSRTLSDALNKNVDVITYSALEHSKLKKTIDDEVVLYERP